MFASSRRFRAGAAALAFVIACFCASLATAAKSPPDVDSLDQATASMLKIQNQIKNARMKLENGIVGMSNSVPRGTPTPARTCCSSNLEGLERNLSVLRGSLEGLLACYDAGGDADGVAAAQFARQDLGLVERSVQEFEMATGQGQATTSIGPMTRNFNALRSSLEKLAPCPKAGSKKKRKGKRKKNS